ncbi:hypothetical protein SKAU_G00277720 [Synaphobranchus kaupii]|uniref:Uncharacterized protein n=1 Tax=Synaphobranchus kaupii TaxID=118154 RepID=A0A9Q1EWG7_SYNKA|nr:hypothetical protein SKAU_G00277720 [Synaphobranchus kaupii]
MYRRNGLTANVSATSATPELYTVSEVGFHGADGGRTLQSLLLLCSGTGTSFCLSVLLGSVVFPSRPHRLPQPLCTARKSAGTRTPSLLSDAHAISLQARKLPDSSPCFPLPEHTLSPQDIL